MDATSQHVEAEDTNLHILEPHQFCNRCLRVGSRPFEKFCIVEKTKLEQLQDFKNFRCLNSGENSFEGCSSDTCTANRENLFDLLYILTDEDVRKEVQRTLDGFEQIEIEYR